MSAEKREQVRATVKAMIVDIQSKQSVQQSPENQAIVTNANAFSKFMDLNCSKKRKIEKNAEELEIDKYLAMIVSCDTNVLDFWKQNKSLKSLQALARNILNIPVSSATSEGFFSTSGIILNEKRTRLTSSNLDKILFLHKNMYLNE